MDILGSEHQKKLIRLAIWFLRKKLGKAASGAAIHQDMQHAGNPVVQIVTRIINEASENITDEEYQRNTVRELSELGLWIVSKDTAYRDVFFWVIKQMIDHKEELESALDGYYKEPDHWYVNAWSRTKTNTKKARKDGEIPEFAMSHDEEIYTPYHQDKKLDKYKNK